MQALFMAMVRKGVVVVVVVVKDLLRGGGRVAMEGFFPHGGVGEGQGAEEKHVGFEACDVRGKSASSHFDWV